MSMAFLDGDGDFALALREPALLVPGQKPLKPPALGSGSLTDGLIALVYEAGGGVPVDLVSNRKTTVSGTTSAYASYSGLGTLFGSSASDYDSLDVADGAFNIDGSSKITLFADFYTSRVAAPQTFGLSRYSDISNYLIIRINHTGAAAPNCINTFLQLGDTNLVSVVTLPDNSLPDSLAHVVFGVTIDYPTKTATVRCMVNGVMYEGQNTGTGSIAGAITSSDVDTLCSGTVSTQDFDGVMLMRGWWRRALSAAELDQLVRDPYRALLQPANQSPYLVSVAGGATIEVSVTTGAVTLTGVNTGISQTRNIPVTTGALTLTGVAAVITQYQLTNIAVGVGTVTLTGVTATIGKQQPISVTTDAVTLTGINATIGKTQPITATTGSIAITAVNASIIGTTIIAVTTGAITITGFNSVISQAGLTWTEVSGASNNWVEVSPASNSWTEI